MKFAWVNYFERAKDKTISRDCWKLFDNNVTMWDFIFSKSYDNSNLYIFGHNVYFDLQCSGFFNYALDKGWRLNFIYEEGLTFILTITNFQKKIKIISTTNFYDFSLKKIGEILNIPKLEVDFEHDSDEYLKEYCRNDVLITREALLHYIDFVDEHDMGNFSLTKASQAFNAYRHRFMHTNICVHKENDIVELERDSYLGGRNEAFELGDKRSFEYMENIFQPIVPP